MLDDGPSPLCVIGDLVEDVMVRAVAWPERGTDTAATIVRTRGGSAANVSAAAVAAGCPTRFIGRVGADTTGDGLVASLMSADVGVRVQRAGRSGCVVVLVEPGGERTMLPDRAAAAELSAIDPAWLAGVRWLHVPAYSLCAEPIGTSTIDAAHVVRKAGGQLSIDVSSVGTVSAFGPARFVEIVAALAPDVVLATAEEAALLGTWRPTVLVVKDGSRPIVIERADGSTERVDVTRIDDVVDTTGAGDAFAGGFLAAVLRGESMPAAASAGAALATRTLRTAGAGIAPA